MHIPFPWRKRSGAPTYEALGQKAVKVPSIVAWIVGILTPLNIASRAVLLDELKARGARTDEIPTPCLYELATANLKRAKLLVGHTVGSATEGLFSVTSERADRIAELLGVQDIDRRESSWATDGRIEFGAILARHGMKLPDTSRKKIS